MSVTAVSARRETHVIGLISMAHMLSHLYMLALPPLFPLMRDDLGIGYAELGLAITAFAVRVTLKRAAANIEPEDTSFGVWGEDARERGKNYYRRKR